MRFYVSCPLAERSRSRVTGLSSGVFLMNIDSFWKRSHRGKCHSAGGDFLSPATPLFWRLFPSESSSCLTSCDGRQIQSGWYLRCGWMVVPSLGSEKNDGITPERRATPAQFSPAADMESSYVALTYPSHIHLTPRESCV